MEFSNSSPQSFCWKNLNIIVVDIFAHCRMVKEQSLSRQTAQTQKAPEDWVEAPLSRAEHLTSHVVFHPRRMSYISIFCIPLP